MFIVVFIFWLLGSWSSRVLLVLQRVSESEEETESRSGGIESPVERRGASQGKTERERSRGGH